MEILRDYTEECNQKARELAVYLEEENMKEYKVLVHSLKSSSKTIGAGEVSELAKALEDASGADDKEFVKANHEHFIQEYRKTAKSIKAIINS